MSLFGNPLDNEYEMIPTDQFSQTTGSFNRSSGKRTRQWLLGGGVFVLFVFLVVSFSSGKPAAVASEVETLYNEVVPARLVFAQKSKKDDKKKRKGGKSESPSLRKRVLEHEENPFNQNSTVEFHPTEPDYSDFWSTEGPAKTPSKSHEEEHDPEMRKAIRFWHISDPHVDPYFTPFESSQSGVCHSCKFNSRVFGDDAYCPLTLPDEQDTAHHDALLGYAFGRFRCNPPPRLMRSLLHFLVQHNPNPDFVVITGDIAPHGFPDDLYNIQKDTKLSDLCPTKYIIFKHNLKQIRAAFPTTPFAFSLGNNDHIPKNKFWPPAIKKIGELLVKQGFLDKNQVSDFNTCGAHYVDLEHETQKLRILLPDMTLFTHGGELTFPPPPAAGLRGLALEDAQFPARGATVRWMERVQKEAKAQGRKIILAVHQPQLLKKGKEELLLSTEHGRAMMSLLVEHKSRITVALAGHRNLSGISIVRGPLGESISASITAPGLSARGNNNPAVHEVFMNDKILDFKQYVFDLLEENERGLLEARLTQMKDLKFSKEQENASISALGTYNPLGREVSPEQLKMSRNEKGEYLGSWLHEGRGVWSWRRLSKMDYLDAKSVEATQLRSQYDSELFVALQHFKQAGFVGNETPENVLCSSVQSQEDAIMKCLFPEQDERCFDNAWLR